MGKRKQHLAVLAMMLVVLVPLASWAAPLVEKMYGETVSGLVFIYLSFAGANVGEYWANRKGLPVKK